MTTRSNIPPNPPRWKPSNDPSSIVVPGLDTEASTIDQIEQIEQLITIKLQNVDENFSKIQNILGNKLLPAVKRYAVGTEPARDAAKFWTSFYEQAAQIRIPTYEDYSAVNERPSEQEQEETGTGHSEQSTQEVNEDPTHASHISHDPSIAGNESSFMPAHAAFSSTPAMGRVAESHAFADESGDPSWSASIESPLIRLNREIQNFSLEPDITPAASTSTPSMRQIDDSTRQTHTLDQERTISRSDKGKSKDVSQNLLKGVLRHNLYSASDISSGDLSSVRISPLKTKAKIKTPVSKTLNPYIPPDSTPDDWRGVVDLRDPRISSPQRSKKERHVVEKPTTPRRNARSGDESFDGLPAGMSPPVMISPSRAKFAKNPSPYKIGRTPTKEASARIKQDLLRTTQLKNAAKATKQPEFHDRKAKAKASQPVDSSSSTLPTPPSYSRYSTSDTSGRSITKDSSLESMMRRIETDAHETAGLRPTNIFGVQPMHSESSIDDSFIQHDYTNPMTPVFNQMDNDLDSDSDSMDEINNTAHPSAAFLMASRGMPYDDDSFGSNHSSDSLEEEAAQEGLHPVHPFAQSIEDDGFDDDSFDDYNGEGGGGGGEHQEETVFGVPPAQRAQPARQFGGGNLRMLGEELLEDTIGIGAQIAASGKVEESPTPAGWGR